jgi:prepilin-type N-terminal cleavage/methylation domain-containing protein
MKSRQTGFTLIELVMVIVLIGVLAAVAVPKFVDLGSDARAAAAQGVAGGLSSAAATNYAARKANASLSGTFAVDNCDDAGQMLQGGLPTGYTITSGAIAADVTKSDCVVNAPSNAASAAFTATGIN